MLVSIRVRDLFLVAAGRHGWAIVSPVGVVPDTFLVLHSLSQLWLHSNRDYRWIEENDIMQGRLWILRISTGLLLIGLLGCGDLARSVMNFDFIQQVRITKIGDIQKQSLTTTVYLKGNVVKKVPLLNALVYQLEDASGSVWVLTQNRLIQLGDELTVKGKVHYQSIPIEGQDLGAIYIEEIERLQPPLVQP